jgi:CCT motif
MWACALLLTVMDCCGVEQIVELTTPEGHTYRVHKLNPEERTQKILRYRQKRHERNFTKRIKYQCRKTLADSRPRVRGRFAGMMTQAL